MNEVISFEPLSILFYGLGIILPTLTYVQNITHLVYTVGEYKLSNTILPWIILLISISMGINGLVVVTVYNKIFDNILYVGSISTLIIFLWGILIFIDSFLYSKILKIIDRYRVEKDTFGKYLSSKYTKLMKHYLLLFVIKFILVISLFCLIIYNIIFVRCKIAMNELDVLLFIYILLNYNMIKYFKKINTVE